MQGARRIATLALLVGLLAEILSATATASAATPPPVGTSAAGAVTAVAGASASLASGVTARSTCAAPLPGRISCDAQILVSARTGRPIHPHPRHRKRHRRRKHVKHAHAASVAGVQPPQPMTPAYLQQAYDLTYLAANRGAGDTVAVVAVYDDPTAAADLATFRSTYDLPSCGPANGCFQQLNEQGQTAPLPSANTSWAQEESMDLDAVSSICPNCKIDLVEANAADAQDLQTAISSAIHAGANQVSISGAGQFSANPFTDFSAPNVSILAAAGDDGVVPQGMANYPAALPYVTAVGGTALTPDVAGAPSPRGVTETAWSQSGSGCDTQEQPLPFQPSVGCAGRVYSDVSADADPATGLSFYDSQSGGWLDGGGTSLATPMVAAFEALTGVDGSSPQWAYADAANLNPTATSSTGACPGQLPVLCNAGSGWSGPTGAGSISGQIVAGAPGIGEPSLGPSSDKTYVRRVTRTGAYLLGGVYPNGEPTTYHWEYGPTTDYGQRSRSYSAGAGTAPVVATGHLVKLDPGTTYHFRLVAVNSSGTSYGYDFKLHTGGRASAARAKRERRARRGHRRPRHGAAHASTT